VFRRVAQVGYQENLKDPLIIAKYSIPAGVGTCYADYLDRENILFRLINRIELELVYFSLKELLLIKDSMALAIERDLYYEPKSLKDLIELH
jgi:hypothetical protein